MHGDLYLLQDGDRMLELTEVAYESPEELLDELLGRHPGLLAGEQAAAAPRRWLLVLEEFGLPYEEGTVRWSVERLFLDQDAVPTLVELRRAGDAHLRREAAAQMLDDAANGLLCWPIETLRAQFEDLCEQQGVNPEQALRTVLEPGVTPEQYWQQARANLVAGRIRLVFVSDEIPADFRRIVELLAAQMRPAEVLAVELKRYTGEGRKVLVPRVLGRAAAAVPSPTAAAALAGAPATVAAQPPAPQPGPGARRAPVARGPVEAHVARKIFEWSQGRGLRILWGKGSDQGSFLPVFDHRDVAHPLFSVWSHGALEIPFHRLRKSPPFDAEPPRLELRERLNRIPGIAVPIGEVDRHPRIPLAVLHDDIALNDFFDVVEWVVRTIEAVPPEATSPQDASGPEA